MPNIGDQCGAKELGYSGRAMFHWVACPDCGKERWIANYQRSRLCQSCAAQRRARLSSPITYTGSGEPKLGDATTARLLGLKDNGIRYFVACIKCGLGHWVRRAYKDTPCVHCIPHARAERHPSWCGGVKIKRDYTWVLIGETDPFYQMSKQGWIPEHRLVVARSLGRKLEPREIVHHRNGIKSDNRIENLQLLPYSKHHPYLAVRALNDQVIALTDRVASLESESALLKAVLKEIRDSVPDCRPILQRYNTPGGIIEIAEGIVQASSNGGQLKSA